MNKDTVAKILLANMLLLNSTADVASKDKPQRLAVLEDVKILTAPPNYGEQQKSSEDDILAMGRRIQEDATVGVPVETNLKASTDLPATCTSGETCALSFGIQNTGKIDVSSPILISVSLGAAGGKDAATKTPGWTCGYADPKLTCASTGVLLQPGDRTGFTVDWAAPVVTAEKKAKICMSFVWVGRSNDGVYRAEQISAVQYALQRGGFETGGIDGRIRPKTLQAIRLLRDVVQIPGPAQITPDLLENLFGEAGKISNDANSEDDTACADVTISPAQLVADKKGVVIKPQENVAPETEKAEERLVEEHAVAAAPAVKSKEEIDAERKAKLAAAFPAAKPAETVAAAPAVKSKEEIDAERKAKLAAAFPATKPAETVAAAPIMKSKAEVDAERKAKLAAALPAAKPAEKMAATPAVKSKAEIDAERKAKLAAALPLPAKAEQKPAAATTETKTPVVKTETKPAVAKAEVKAVTPVKAEAKASAPAKTNAPAQVIAATEPVKESKPEAVKATDRLEPSKTAPKMKTSIISTLPSGRPAPVVAPKASKAVPVETYVEEEIVIDRKAQARAAAEQRYIVDKPLTIISTENEDELVYHRSSEESSDGSYTVNRGEEGTYTPSRHRTTTTSAACDCKKVASLNMPRRTTAKAPTARSRRAARMPSGADIVNGWPYRE